MEHNITSSLCSCTTSAMTPTDSVPPLLNDLCRCGLTHTIHRSYHGSELYISLYVMFPFRRARMFDVTERVRTGQNLLDSDSVESNYVTSTTFRVCTCNEGCMFVFRNLWKINTICARIKNDDDATMRAQRQTFVLTPATKVAVSVGASFRVVVGWRGE